MAEKWEDIPGFKGKYQASSGGCLRSVDRIAKISGRLIKGRVLKTILNRRGYLAIGMMGKTRSVHRLIALTFIPNPENKATINHKNGIKSDNRVENLEWATCSENVMHGVRTGLYPTKISESDVRFIRENFKKKGRNELAKMFKVSAAYIYDIATHRFKGYVEGEIYQTNSPMFCKPIDQYDLSGALISRHPSTKAAAKAIGKKIGAVQRVVKGERRSLGGFVFKYAADPF